MMIKYWMACQMWRRMGKYRYSTQTRESDKGGTVDGVDIHVVVDGAGKVTSGWPVGGYGVKNTPSK